MHWLGMTAMVVWKQQAWWHQWSGSWFSMVVWMHLLLLTLWQSFSRVSKFMDSMTLIRVVCCCLVPSCMSYFGLSTLKYLRSVTCSIPYWHNQMFTFVTIGPIDRFKQLNYRILLCTKSRLSVVYCSLKLIWSYIKNV